MNSSLSSSTLSKCVRFLLHNQTETLSRLAISAWGLLVSSVGRQGGNVRIHLIEKRCQEQGINLSHPELFVRAKYLNFALQKGTCLQIFVITGKQLTILVGLSANCSWFVRFIRQLGLYRRRMKIVLLFASLIILPHTID